MDEREAMITDRQANMLAHVLHEIRPSWAIDGTRKVFERNKDHPSPFADILAAAVTAARDPDTQTPGRIFQVSLHWPPAAKARLPKPEPCEDHIGQDAHTCRSCWADLKAGIRPQTHIGKHYEAVWEEAASDVQEDE
jgi:hypothetical protein